MKKINKLIIIILTLVFCFNSVVHSQNIKNENNNDTKETLTFNYDLAIINATIYNPMTDEIYHSYNISISNGKIKEVSKKEVKANRIIDAKNMIVCPSFIEVDGINVDKKTDLLKTSDGIGTSVRLNTVDIDRWEIENKDFLSTVDYLSSTGAEDIKNLLMENNDDKNNESRLYDDFFKIIDREVHLKTSGLKISYKNNDDDDILNKISDKCKDNKLTLYIDLKKASNKDIIMTLNNIISKVKDKNIKTVFLNINRFASPYKIKEIDKLINTANSERENFYYTFNPFNYVTVKSDNDGINFIKGFQNSDNKIQIYDSELFYNPKDIDKLQNAEKDLIVYDVLSREDLDIIFKSKYSLIGCSNSSSAKSDILYPFNVNSFTKFIKEAKDKNTLDLMSIFRKICVNPYLALDLYKYENAASIEPGANASLNIIDIDSINVSSNVSDVKPSDGVKYVIHNGIVIYNNGQNNQDGSIGKILNKGEEDKNVKRLTALRIKGENLNTSINNRYNIDNKEYFPVLDICKNLNLVINKDNNGIYTIGNLIKLEIGSNKLYIGTESINLNEAIFYYKNSLLMSAADFINVFNRFYNIEINPDEIKFADGNNTKLLDTMDSVSKNINLNMQIKNSYILISYLISAMFIFYLYNRLRRKKRRNKNGTV